MQLPAKHITNPIEPVNNNWLFIFRVSIAGFALFHFLIIQPDFGDLYSYNGYVYPDIMDGLYDHATPTLTSLTETFNSWHLYINYDSLLLFCRLAYPLVLFFLLIGIFTRMSAIASLFFQLLLLKSIHLYEYGVDFYTTFSLFYCCVFPVGKIRSLDNRIFKPRLPTYPLLYLRLLQAHLAVAYFFSGFDKIIGVTWRNGEAIWKTLHSHNYFTVFNLDFLSGTPAFFIGGWLTIIFEMGYPVFMNRAGTRKAWLRGIIGLHLFIGLFMGLFLFATLLILLNLATWQAPYRKAGSLKWLNQ